AQSGMLSFKMQKTQILDLIQTTIESYKSAAKQKNLHLELRFDERFKKVEIDADAPRLSRVFEELIDNAIKFTNSGGIRIECQFREDLILVKVVDTGSAIPEEILPRLFDIFSSKSYDDASVQGAG